MSSETMISKTKKPAPFLIIAVGNRSRGDDSLGPLLLEQLQQTEAMSLDVEFLEDYQLQVEHALDIRDRQLAIEGESFGLGENLSAVAEKHLKLAFDTAREWLAERRYELAKRESLSPGTSSCLKDSDHA